MPKSHRPYPLEYRQRIVELVRKGADARGTVAPVRAVGPAHPDLGAAGRPG